ncbi:hypothetical protein LUZ63_000134 [Rhynchospora breviuscula]|uniref:Uncharacterized protein n=1 Tax=Rhynchospora breviuscula TaxID=2022672 RepID=A0A9Q0CUZ1_9POAL|nr:hypothetical protein LUZ63_000134 [Rhynchospora breviuscula]
MSNQQTVKIINQDKSGDYCLAVRGGKLVVNFSNPGDPYQRWIKKEYIDKKDQEGQPAFALINEATKAAIRLDGTTGPVSLVPYNLVDGTSDENSVLWTMSKNSDKNFRRIRRASNMSYHITPKDFQVEDGRRVEMRSENLPAARWKFVKDSTDTIPGSAGTGPESAGTEPGGSGTGPGSAGTGPGSAGTGPGSAGTGPGSAGTGPGSTGTGPGGASTCCGQGERSNNVAP